MERHKISISMDTHNIKLNSYGYEIDISKYNIDYISGIYKSGVLYGGLKYGYNTIKKRLTIITNCYIERIDIYYFSPIEDRNRKIDKLLKY